MLFKFIPLLLYAGSFSNSDKLLRLINEFKFFIAIGIALQQSTENIIYYITLENICLGGNIKIFVMQNFQKIQKLLVAKPEKWDCQQKS